MNLFIQLLVLLTADESEIEDEEELDLEEGLFDDPALMTTEHLETPVSRDEIEWE